MTSFAEELVRVHVEYLRNVPNNYAATISRIAKAVSERDIPGVAEALAAWLKSINQQYYRFRPDEARTFGLNWSSSWRRSCTLFWDSANA